MEANVVTKAATAAEIGALFSDLVRLETDLWNAVDRRLQNEHDLALSWFEPMQVMDRVPDCRVADIAQALSITVGGTSKLVDRIEDAGWCTRAPNPTDARSSVVALTRAGRRLLGAAEGSFDDELRVCLAAAVPPEELAGFAATVRDLRRHLADRQESTT